MIKKTLIVLTLLATCTTANAAPIVHLSDFINDGDRTNFNGFESIPNDGNFFIGGSGPYLEDGISVRQVNGNGGNTIYVHYLGGGQHQGNFSWSPGDFGYTELTRGGGIDFENVGMLIDSGYSRSASLVFYELLDNGSSILTGNYHLSFGDYYLGFSGGGFDTIRLNECYSLSCDPSTATLTDGHYNALALDSIELSGATVPEPSTLLLLGSGLVGLAAWRWKRAG